MSDVKYRHNQFRLTDLSITINHNSPKQFDLYISHRTNPIVHYRFEDEQLANKVYEQIFQRIAKVSASEAIDIAYGYVLLESTTDGYHGKVWKFREGGELKDVSYDIPTYEPGS